MLVITPVGTSLLERCRERREDLGLHLGYLRDQLAETWESNSRRIENTKKILRMCAIEDEDISAEVQSIRKIRQQSVQPVVVRLIATDTILSRLAAEVLVEAWSARGGSKTEVLFQPEVDVIKGLQVRDRRRFDKEGLPNLVERIETLKLGVGATSDIAINITGGYKALIPYLTIMGQVHNMPLYYIFEGTDELIRIPQAPLDIKWDLFAKYRTVLEDLAEGVYDWDRYRQTNPLEGDFQACVWVEDGMAGLNAIGRMFWERFKRFFIVWVLRGSSYESDSKGNLKEVNDALKELFARLTILTSEASLATTADLQARIVSLGSQNDLRHGDNPDKDKFIFKSTRNTQIRLVYSPEIERGGLSLKLFDHVRGNFDHTSYHSEFRSHKRWKEQVFVPVPLEKP